jgi:WD40 repeat protein
MKFHQYNLLYKHKIQIYNIKESSLIKINNSEEKKLGMLMCMKWYNENILASGFESGTIILNDIRNLSEPYQAINELYKDPILSLNFSETKMIAGSTNNIIQIYDISESKPIHKYELKSEGISDISVRRDNRVFVVGGWDNKIRFFDLKKNKTLGFVDHHSKSINTVDYNRNNDLLAVSSKDSRISIWDIEFQKKKK